MKKIQIFLKIIEIALGIINSILIILALANFENLTSNNISGIIFVIVIYTIIIILHVGFEIVGTLKNWRY